MTENKKMATSIWKGQGVIRAIACSMLAMAIVFAASKAHAEVITVFANHDTWLDINNPDTVRGFDETMTTVQGVEGEGPVFSLKRNVILKFDWDAIPGFYGSTINSAVLRMQYEGDFNGEVAHSGAIHNVQADWDEATATYNLGGPTGPGHGIFVNNDGGLNFHATGGWFFIGGEADTILEWDLEGEDGADLDANAGQQSDDRLGLISMYASGDYSGTGAWPAQGTDIVNPNYGILIRTGNNFQTFYTKENTVGALHPQIVLDYEPFDPNTSIPGDANGDGVVDVADLGILGANFGQSGLTVSEGDFNGDGIGDVADLGIIGANWTAGSAAAFVPEPATLSPLAMSVLIIGRRRRA